MYLVFTRKPGEIPLATDVFAYGNSIPPGMCINTRYIN